MTFQPPSHGPASLVTSMTMSLEQKHPKAARRRSTLARWEDEEVVGRASPYQGPWPASPYKKLGILHGYILTYMPPRGPAFDAVGRYVITSPQSLIRKATVASRNRNGLRLSICPDPLTPYHLPPSQLSFEAPRRLPQSNSSREMTLWPWSLT